MRIAHLITAYKNPYQLERLLKATYHDNSDFYIHLDGNVDFGEYEFLENMNRVFFIKNRIKVVWGGYSFTQAIFNSITEILNTGINYSFINLMSSQDYPIKSISCLYEYLKEREGYSFVSYALPDKEIWWKETMTRITSYNFNDYKFKGRYLIQRIVNQLLPKRKFPLPVKLYGSSCATWWTLSTGCAQYLVDYMNSNKKLSNFMCYTWGPDEYLIPTLLMNSPHKDSIINDNLRYIDWSQGGARPKLLTLSDLSALKECGKFLARKFDPELDSEVLDHLDEFIHVNS
ncbi:MAG: beta-1,6-N-acetylglucosaminyltransferase [Cytophagaceae bacterium]|nr:beta-1,6-N-acetylglucosaminyltransferase [Cytophagaceae bacterium]